uniref:DNA replication licensing factor MCM2 n=1 Tax=Globodera rostochiensis TaxID=31243 RepID=A0A914I6K7_GLORO
MSDNESLHSENEEETQQSANDDDEDPLAELYGDERDQLDEEDGVEGEDLYGDDMMRDYREQPELDALSQSGIDDTSDITELSVDARRQAELAMARRDQMTLDDALYWEEGDDEGIHFMQRRKQRGLAADDGRLSSGEQQPDEDIRIDIIENPRGRPTRDHVKDEVIAKEIEKRFCKFLRVFKDPMNKQNKYIQAIKHMVAENRESLEVDYNDLAHESGEPDITYFLPEAPIEMLECLNRAATTVVVSIFPWYHRITNEVKARIKNLPMEEDIRMLRQLGIVKYDCKTCAYVLGPFIQRQNEETKPSTCPSCQSRGPFELNAEETIYHNYQRVSIQESPNLVAAGRLPRSKEVILLGDLCDSCKPGDEIELTGVYTNSYDGSLNSRQGFPVFNTVIIANHIVRKDRIESDSLTDEDIKAIHELSKHPQIAQQIFCSIAPNIYGHAEVKQAIALALFGGEAKNPQGKHNIRGDINVLLCGDPGTAKSQFLRFLLASQRAMVLADTGVCLIDEFDKMNEQDRTSIHEAMEQQSISISKAGIVTSLKARCTVIAASNPIGGRYDSSRTFAANVDLTEPILSRFDILCVMRDQADPKMHPDVQQAVADTQEKEENIVEFDSMTGTELIPLSLLRKFLIYARDHIHPKLEVDDERISKLYSDLRRESDETGSVAITIRNVESIIRMAEAHAKMHLRNYVNDDDVSVAMKVMLQGFISTQKASVMRQMKKKFWRQLNYKRENNDLLLFVLKQLVNEHIVYERARYGGANGSGSMDIETVAIPETEFLEKAHQLRIDSAKKFYKSCQFTSNHFQFDAHRKLIKLAGSAMSSELRLDSSLDLMRRLPPQNCEKNLTDLVALAPDLCESLLTAIDQPLKVAKDKATGREYLLCDYNRDGDSYRSPWTNTYEPPIEDGVSPSDTIRKLEIEVNAAFEAYRDMYFEGGVSSVYLWDIDNGFAGVVLLKKKTDGSVSGKQDVRGCWDSIHVLEVNEKAKASKFAKYKLTSTVMLWLQTQNPSTTGTIDLGGSLTRQTEHDCAVTDQNPHLANIGKLIEDQESKMRATLNEVYFGKARQIVGDLRSVESTAELKNREELVDDLKKAVSGKRTSKEEL